MCPFGKEQAVTKEPCTEDKYLTHTTGIQNLYLADKWTYAAAQVVPDFYCSELTQSAHYKLSEGVRCVQVSYDHGLLVDIWSFDTLMR
jgi:hypothetical protein